MVKELHTKSCDFVIVGASVMGFDKADNQDTFEFGSNDDALCVSVCDGLGSVRRAKEGSELAAKTLVRMALSGSVDGNDLLQTWRDSLPSGANEASFNTTAKFALLSGNNALVGGIGDGLIAMWDRGKVYLHSSKGEFANQTASILDLSGLQKFTQESWRFGPGSLLMIGTDGFTEDLDREKLGDLLAKIADEMASKPDDFEKSLLRLLEKWPNSTNGDDKTVCFVLNRGNH
jgi:serine/threonine protein phosphatase PrpC